MLSTHEARAVAQHAVDFLGTNAIPFHRGDAVDYLRRIAVLSSGLTLPIVPPSREAEVVAIKTMYALWNVVVDDEIDRGGTRRGLDESLVALIELPLERRERDGAAAILAWILERVPTDRGDDARVAIHFDLWEAANGFVYEYALNRSRRLANSIEYRKYSAMTASMKLHLDVDVAFAADAIDDASYRRLRVAYDALSTAIKYASDVGSLRRELVEEDNLNAVLIAALEEGAAPRSGPVHADAYPAYVASLDGVIARTRASALASLAEARTMLAALPGIDARGVLSAVSSLVGTYSDGVDFH